MRYALSHVRLSRHVISLAFLSAPLALLLLSAGCQDQGAGASASSTRTTTVTESRQPAGGEAQTASARQSASASRGGRSPANSVAPDRPEGGTDRRTQGPTMRNSFAFPTGDRATSVVMLEADTPQQVRVGQPYSYSLRLTNLTDTPVHDVIVYDASPAAAATTASAGIRGNMSPANEASGEAARRATSGPSEERVLWNAGTLAPKATVTQQLRGSADQEGTLSNCLGVRYEPTLCVAVQVVRPELTITKTGPADALVCEPLTYTYRVTNSGTGVARDVRVEDSLPEGLTTDRGQQAVAFNAGDIPAGQTKEGMVRLKATRTGRFASRAIARSGETEAQTRELVTTLRQPVLTVAVEGPEAQYVGEAINYRVTVRNTGDAPAQKAVLHLAAEGAADKIADRDLGTIEPGATRTIPVTTRGARSAQQVRLSARAEAQCAQPAAEETTVAIRTIAALLVECVDSTDPVQIGGDTVYTIVVRNQGTGPDTNVGMTVNLPQELQFVKADGTTKGDVQGQQIQFAPVATLPAGQQAQWTVEVKAVRAGDARFRVDVKSDSLTTDATETEPTRVIP